MDSFRPVACCIILLGCTCVSYADGLDVSAGSVMADEDPGARPDRAPAAPVTIVGTCNGAFSGVVTITSTLPMKGLRARIDGLRRIGGEGVIPASALTVRYALPEHWRQVDRPDTYPVDAFRGFRGLSERPPDVVPVIKTVGARTPAPLGRAVQPVWVTVRVPADAATGDYEGTLVVRAGADAVKVPVRLSVMGWRLPAPRDFRTFVDLVESPETLALEYDVPMWSDAHFKLIEKSLDVRSGIGDKTVYLHLVAETNHGNAHTLVTWTRDGDGWRYDFAPMNRYLDLVEKHGGIPAVVCLYVWDAWMEGGGHRSLEYWKKIGDTKRLNAWQENVGGGPIVSVKDPATGALTPTALPPRTTPEGYATWLHFTQALRKEIAKRDLADRVALGMLGDQVPAKEVLDVFTKSMPGVPWVKQSHSMKVYNDNAKDADGWTVKYGAFVWVPQGVHPTKRLYGWKQNDLRACYPRSTRNSSPVISFRLMGEMIITGSQRGPGRIGAEFWPVIKNSRGHVVGDITGRFPQAEWKNLDIRLSMLAPGPDGPVATRRFEMMREGIQECEARIYIENALTDPALRAKLGETLAKQCETMLTERNLAILKGFNITEPDNWRDVYKWQGYGKTNFNEDTYRNTWQDLSRRLYAGAADVAAKLDVR